MTGKMNLKIIVYLFLLILASPFVLSLDANETIQALNRSSFSIQNLEGQGFDVKRLNDSYTEAVQLFNAQFAYEETGGEPNYALVISRTTTIQELGELILESSDELKALQDRLQFIDEKSGAHALYQQANQEFEDERYENIESLTEQAYSLIIEEQAVETRVQAVYTSSRENLQAHLDEHIDEWVLAMAVGIILLLLFKKRVSILLTDLKRKSLGVEKEVYQKLIENTQNDYFHEMNIPEELYHVRLQKYGDLIRNANRQVPLLLQKKAKLMGIENLKFTPRQIKLVRNTSSFLVILGMIFLGWGYHTFVSGKEPGIFSPVHLLLEQGLSLFFTLSLVTLFALYWMTNKGVQYILKGLPPIAFSALLPPWVQTSMMKVKFWVHIGITRVLAIARIGPLKDSKLTRQELLWQQRIFLVGRKLKNLLHLFNFRKKEH